MYVVLAIVAFVVVVALYVKVLLAGLTRLDDWIPDPTWEEVLRFRVLVPLAILLGGAVLWLEPPAESEAADAPLEVDCCSCCCEQDLPGCAVVSVESPCVSSK